MNFNNYWTDPNLNYIQRLDNDINIQIKYIDLSVQRRPIHVPRAIIADRAEQKPKAVAEQVAQIAQPVVNPPKDKDEKLCNICMDRKINAVAVPCGHLRYCFECIQQINDCSICRKRIEQKVKVY